MPTDEKDEAVEVEVLPKGWDQKPAKVWQPVDLKSPMTWLLIPPAIIFAFGMVFYMVGVHLQQKYGPPDQE